jgi:hypothetical protein
MYYLIDMNLPGFTVPNTLAHRPPTQETQENYRKALNVWRDVKASAEKNNDQSVLATIEDIKPSAPQTVIITNAAVCHDIMKTALTMATPEGNPDTLRRLQKIHKAIEDGLENKGQLKLSTDEHRFLQSKYAKADKWNTAPDVCKTVIAVQDAITRAAMVTTNEK